MKTQNEKQKSQNYNQKPKNDLKQRAYQYSIKLINFIDELAKDTSTQIIAKQLLRSGTSIGLLRDTQKADKEKTNFLLQETIELSNILASSIITIRGKRTF